MSTKKFVDNLIENVGKQIEKAASKNEYFFKVLF